MTSPLGAVGPPTGADLSERVALAVLAVPGVAALHGGTYGEIATYLPGRRAVAGVRIREDAAEIHLVLFWGTPVLACAERVRQVVEPLVGTSVDITVQDLTTASASR